MTVKNHPTMPKIKKITDAGVQIYPLTIPQAVIDPSTGTSVAELLDGKLISSVTSQETASHDIEVTFNFTDGTTSEVTIPSSGLDYDDLERLTESEIETLLDL